MFILTDDTALQHINLHRLYLDKADVVQFVREALNKSKDVPMSIIITRPGKSEEFYVGTVTTESWADIEIQNSSDELQIT